MILHPNPWEGHNGASHRRNVDTPSLIGSCRYTTVNLFGNKELRHAGIPGYTGFGGAQNAPARFTK